MSGRRFEGVVKVFERPWIMSASPDLFPGATVASFGPAARNNAVFLNANDASLFPFYLDHFIVVDKLWWVNGTNTTGNADCGIYDASFNRLVSTGSTARSGLDTRQVVDVTDALLVPGEYYLALACASNAGTFYTQTINTVKGRTVGAYTAASSLPLPATIIPGTFTSYWAWCGLTPKN